MLWAISNGIEQALSSAASVPPQPGHCTVTPPRLPHLLHRVRFLSMSLEACGPQRTMAGVSAIGARCRHAQRGQCNHTQL